MNLAWATDIHLNFLSRLRERRYAFYTTLCDTNADAILLTGDIADAPSVRAFLVELEEVVARPVYFVLGNHDFYHGSIAEVRTEIRALCADNNTLVYLPDADPVALDETSCLIGVDGWGDGGYGDQKNFASLNDYNIIAEYYERHRGSRRRDLILKEMRYRGKIEGALTTQKLTVALEKFTTILFATHVPPFVEAAWHEGRHSEPAWQCGFVCRAVGDALLNQMRDRPDHQMMVVCGHTHSAGHVDVLPNVHAWTAGAEYAAPRVEAVLEF